MGVKNSFDTARDVLRMFIKACEHDLATCRGLKAENRARLDDLRQRLLKVQGRVRKADLWRKCRRENMNALERAGCEWLRRRRRNATYYVQRKEKGLPLRGSRTSACARKAQYNARQRDRDRTKRCMYTGCERPTESSQFYLIDGESEAGGQDWSGIAGSVLCNACYQRFLKRGTLVQSSLSHGRRPPDQARQASNAGGSASTAEMLARAGGMPKRKACTSGHSCCLPPQLRVSARKGVTQAAKTKAQRADSLRRYYAFKA
eukprot:CAMPEP_0174922144 /NCGR_PEP_ID=MMETSP1355-20121228/5661_1 /TAXON_ID=464990 /ORGANISM="Hemiselmis tepida, Strain CCMP443" /LENGTH=260 /DNA_ID=CAMNT_0016167707 /DNA_START=113 /DNA_END=892 /DNA_ORIENTATION=-